MGLSSLTERDLRRILDVVSPDDTTSSTGQELPMTVMRGLAELIPCSSVTFCLENPLRVEEHLGVHDLDLRDIPPDDEESLALHDRAYADFPPCSQPELVGGPGRASMWQDYFGDREYERTLMAQYYRLGGLRHHLIVLLPSTDGLRRKVVLWRDEGDSPFSERDRLLLTLLRPHLGAIRDRIEAQRHIAPPLTPRQLTLLRRVARGDTNRRIARDLGLSEATVRKHLENIYTRLDVHSRTEALARVGPLQSAG
jgi:DNA-binding CsgD family transcriptional regulator